MPPPLGHYKDAPAILVSKPLGFAEPQLTALLSEYGTPTSDAIRSSVVKPIPADALDRASFALTRDELTVTTGDTGVMAAPTVAGQFQTEIQPSNGCLQVEPLGPDGQAWFGAPSGQAVRLEADGWGDLGVFLAHYDSTFQEAAAIHQTIVSRTPYRIAVPDMAPGFQWAIDFKLGAGIRSVSICLAS
jgi:hypothetical protein